jgi:phenylpropionate dioxygenase-like ring-hydroxylating dioxygenase large terminal subunit
MSDLSISLEALDRSRTQLSVSTYFDEALFREEQRLIFDQGPRYVGHALTVPELGDYHVLGHEADGRALVRGAGGVELISNVCRHRQAVMLKGRGQTGGQVVCPLHRWTYALDGRLLGAPHFDRDPCLNLRRYPLQEWNGLLFEAGRGRDVAADLARLGPAADLRFDGYVYDRTIVHACDYNWKTFIGRAQPSVNNWSIARSTITSRILAKGRWRCS